MIEIIRGEDRQWRWRLLGASNRVLAQSEPYAKRSAALKDIERARGLMASAGVIERLN